MLKKKGRLLLTGNEHAERLGGESHGLIIIEGMMESTRSRGCYQSNKVYVCQIIMNSTEVASYNELQDVVNDKENRKNHIQQSASKKIILKKCLTSLEQTQIF